LRRESVRAEREARALARGAARRLFVLGAERETCKAGAPHERVSAGAASPRQGAAWRGAQVLAKLKGRRRGPRARRGGGGRVQRSAHQSWLRSARVRAWRFPSLRVRRASLTAAAGGHGRAQRAAQREHAGAGALWPRRAACSKLARTPPARAARHGAQVEGLRPADSHADRLLSSESARRESAKRRCVRGCALALTARALPVRAAAHAARGASSGSQRSVQRARSYAVTHVHRRSHIPSSASCQTHSRAPHKQ
jgi:hypothetical protein